MSLIVSNIIAAKVVSIGWIEIPAAVIAVLKSFQADHPMADVAKMLIAKSDAGGDLICRNASAMLIAASDPDQKFRLTDSIIALSYIDAFAPSIGMETR